MVKTIKSIHMHVPTLAELTAKGQKPEVLFWVGCAGSFDERAKKITKCDFWYPLIFNGRFDK